MPLVAEYNELRSELERINLNDAPTEKPDAPAEGAPPAKPRRQRHRRATTTSRARTAKATSAKAKPSAAKSSRSQSASASRVPAKASRGTFRSRSKKPGTSRAPKGGRAEQIANLVTQNLGLTINELGTQLGVDPTGLYQPVRKLIAAGTIRKDGSQLHAAA